MVMDVTPSPQCVGREFVRQYYTLLNKAPTHVHRFYNNNSSFVHGGLEEFDREGKPAVGQKQIHQCIQQLNFRDCHAKITQVDSQATLGNGVVVQVTGELSNGGQPMRRFTQTFVLGAQSPKQYYVHNDIFRYQDLVFGDEEPETDSHHYESIDEEVEHQQPPEMQQVVSTPPPQLPPRNPAASLQQVSQLESQYYSSVPPMPTVNGQPHVEELPAPAPAPVPAYEPPLITPPPQMTSSYTSGSEREEVEREPVLEPEEELLPDEPEEKPIEEPLPSLSPTPTDNVSSNEPKTYASTLVKSGGGVNNFTTSPSAPKSSPSPPPTMTRLESRMNETNLSGGRAGSGARPLRGGPGANMRGGRGSLDSRPPPPRPSPHEDNRDFGGREDGGSDGERRRSSTNTGQYTDDHQLFLGNLPLDASENDLKNLFKKFGTIVDLRIMSKSNNMKGQPGNKVPNYGFIIFDSVQTVQEVLSARPIFFPGDNNVKLNVEEKKTKPRSESGGRGGGGARPTNMMRGALSRGGSRGGFSRGSGGMRPAGTFNPRGAPR